MSMSLVHTVQISAVSLIIRVMSVTVNLRICISAHVVITLAAESHDHV